MAERVRDALARLDERGSREKNVFGGRGFLIGRKAFLIVMEEGLLIKTPPDEYETSLGLRGVERFAPGGERAMSTWVTVSSDLTADDPDLSEWVSRAIRSVR